MTTQPQDPATPTLNAIDVRLSHVEKQVGEIHRAIVGSTDGSIKGLQSRVERLESWGRWIAGMAGSAILMALGSVFKGMGK
jgi:predicted regulator of Ras-like GTPase activity (Roadblock/LC7/MglB family)